MLTPEEITAGLESLSEGFMEPDIQFMTPGEFETEDGDPCEAGWYSRLSAPGYLDCTEWDGPFKTEQEAAEALVLTFGDE